MPKITCDSTVITQEIIDSKNFEAVNLAEFLANTGKKWQLVVSTYENGSQICLLSNGAEIYNSHCSYCNISGVNQIISEGRCLDKLELMATNPSNTTLYLADY